MWLWHRGDCVPSGGSGCDFGEQLSQVARTHNEGALGKCVEAEDAARGDKGRRNPSMTRRVER